MRPVHCISHDHQMCVERQSGALHTQRYQLESKKPFDCHLSPRRVSSVSEFRHFGSRIAFQRMIKTGKLQKFSVAPSAILSILSMVYLDSRSQ